MLWKDNLFVEAVGHLAEALWLAYRQLWETLRYIILYYIILYYKNLNTLLTEGKLPPCREIWSNIRNCTNTDTLHQSVFKNILSTIINILCVCVSFLERLDPVRRSDYSPTDQVRYSTTTLLYCTGFPRSWKTWKSHGILKSNFPGMEKSWN